MRIVTKEEFVNWLKSKPLNTVYNFSGCLITDTCYCPMMAFAVENDISATGCDSNWYQDERIIAEFAPGFGFEDFHIVGNKVPAEQILRKLEEI